MIVSGLHMYALRQILSIIFGNPVSLIIELVSLEINHPIRIGLVARICRSHPSFDGQFRQGRGSIPRFGIEFLLSSINSVSSCVCVAGVSCENER
jgi:hypothetical protein